MMTRTEHLKWAKDRALYYADLGDVANTLSSLHQDMLMHPELREHASGLMEMGTKLAMIGDLNTPKKLRE